VLSVYTEQILKLHYCLLSDAYLLLQLLIRWWLCYLFVKRTKTIRMYVQEENICITGVETLLYCDCIMWFGKSLHTLRIDAVHNVMLLTFQH
jgi:hypothetical protein